LRSCGEGCRWKLRRSVACRCGGSLVRGRRGRVAEAAAIRPRRRRHRSRSTSPGPVHGDGASHVVAGGAEASPAHFSYHCRGSTCWKPARRPSPPQRATRSRWTSRSPHYVRIPKPRMTGLGSMRCLPAARWRTDARERPTRP
jgi:hypothetical protein